MGDNTGTLVDRIVSFVLFRSRDERGASLVEYALLVALIAVVCIVAVTLLGGSAAEKFSDVGGELE